MTTSQIKLHAADPDTQKRRLLELQKKGQKLPIIQSNVPYIPLSLLFDEKGHANKFLFGQIPNGAIIEIVRPNWDLRSQIGTCLNVSHLGFAFWQQGQLVFRQASSEYHQVVEVSLIDYLRKTRQSPTIKGINIQVVIPQRPQNAGC